MKNASYLLNILFFIIPLWVYGQVIDTTFFPHVLSAGRGSVFVLPDDKILIKGDFNYIGEDYIEEIFLRLHPDGKIDTDFTYPSVFRNSPNSIGVQEDGKIIIGGRFRSKEDKFLGNIFRLFPDGHIDSSFSFPSDSSRVVSQLTVLPNQKILMVMTQQFPYPNKTKRFAVHFLERNGNPDPQFKVLQFDNSIGAVEISAIGFQSSNELIFAGSNLKLDTLLQSMYRVDSTGQVDTSFRPNIHAQTVYQTRDMSIAPNGKIGVISGDNKTVTILNRDGTRNQQLVMEYLAGKIIANGDGNFLLVGRNLLSIGMDSSITNYNTGANSLVNTLGRQSDGSIIGGGWFTRFDDNFAPGIFRMKLKEDINEVDFDTTFQGKLYVPGSLN